MENLLFGGNNILKNRYLHIAFDTVNHQNDTVNDNFDTVNDNFDTVFSLIKQNNNITAKEIANTLGKSLSTIKRKLKDLKDRQVIKRIGSDKTGYWEILKDDEK